MLGENWKVAIEDARHRHAAVVNLIYFTDNQAMALLRLYVTVGVAAAAGGAAVLSPNGVIPVVVGWALIAVVVVLGIGSAFCLIAMQAVPLNLPGRGAEFWLWAMDEAIDGAQASRNYLENLEKKQGQNNVLNKRTSKALARARLCGSVAPVAALITAWVARLVV
jgi:hypothetical protein